MPGPGIRPDFCLARRRGEAPRRSLNPGRPTIFRSRERRAAIQNYSCQSERESARTSAPTAPAGPAGASPPRSPLAPASQRHAPLAAQKAAIQSCEQCAGIRKNSGHSDRLPQDLAWRQPRVLTDRSSGHGRLPQGDRSLPRASGTLRSRRRRLRCRAANNVPEFARIPATVSSRAAAEGRGRAGEKDKGQGRPGGQPELSPWKIRQRDGALRPLGDLE